MEKLRKILFYTLSAGYIVFCPLLLLYSFGVILRPEGIIKTGLIYLATLPAGAEILVNGKIEQEKTPTAIRELASGKYSVEIKKTGFLPWSESLPVEEEKATVLDKILLIPYIWEKEAFMEGKNTQVVSFPENTIFIVSKGKSLGDIMVCDYKTMTSWPLLEKESVFTDMPVSEYYSIKGSLAIVVSVKVAGQNRYLWIHIEPEKNTVKDITRLFSLKPSDIQWVAGNSSILFSLENRNISKLDLSKGSIYPNLINGVKGFGLANGKIYFVSRSGECCTTDLNGKEKERLIQDKELAQSLFARARRVSFDIYSDTLFTVKDTRGKLIANKIPYVFAENGIQGTKYFAPLNRLLVWTKEKVGIIDFSKEETGNIDFEKEPKVVWIYTEGKKIDQACWVYQGSHVLFKDKNTVYLIEVEGYDKFEIRKIIDVQKNSKIIYSQEKGEMYFLDPKSSALMFIDIIPEAEVLPEYMKEIKKQKKRNKINELWNTNLPEID